MQLIPIVTLTVVLAVCWAAPTPPESSPQQNIEAAPEADALETAESRFGGWGGGHHHHHGGWGYGGGYGGYGGGYGGGYYGGYGRGYYGGYGRGYGGYGPGLIAGIGFYGRK